MYRVSRLKRKRKKKKKKARVFPFQSTNFNLPTRITRFNRRTRSLCIFICDHSKRVLLSHRFRALVRHRYFVSPTLYNRTVSKLNAYPLGRQGEAWQKLRTRRTKQRPANTAKRRNLPRAIVEKRSSSSIGFAIESVNISECIDSAMSRRLILEYYDDAIRGYTCRMSLAS